MEHRLGHRLSTHRAILVSFGAAAPVQGVLTDMSISGAFIQLSRGAPGVATLKIHWCDPQVTRLPPSPVPAHIVRHADNGVGIEWLNFAPRPVCARLNRYWLREVIEELRG